ncbi:hypothetical protein D9M68_670550 [compost metagenome]
MLSVTASDDSLGQWWKGTFTLAQYLERVRAVPRLESAVVQEAGHMMHHDQPAELARLIEAFLNSAP